LFTKFNCRNALIDLFIQSLAYFTEKTKAEDRDHNVWHKNCDFTLFESTNPDAATKE